MQLFKLENGTFRIEDDGVTIEGQWPQIRAQMIFEFDIDPGQIDRALDDMRVRNHDAADFGISGFFQYSYPTSLDRKVKAELRAIIDLRQEAHALSHSAKGSPMEKDAYERLMNMYICFDAEGALLLLGEVDYGVKAA